MKSAEIPYSEMTEELIREAGYELGVANLGGGRLIQLWGRKGSTFDSNVVTGYVLRGIDHRRVNGKVGIEVGAGVGTLSVIALREMGASSIYASDPAESNYHSLRFNTWHYGLENRLFPSQGYFFDSIPKKVKADFVIADVAGVPNFYAREGTGCYSSDVPAGGEIGDEVLIETLKRSSEFMKSGAVIYFPIGDGLTGNKRILSTAHSVFGRSNVRNAYGDDVKHEVPIGFQKQMDALVQAYGGSLPDTFDIHREERALKEGSKKRPFYFWYGTIMQAIKP